MSFLDTITADLPEFFDDFGEIATFDNGFEVKGIFDNGYLEINVGEAGQEGRQPEFHCPSAALPAGVDEGTILTVGGRNWQVKNLMQDATGVTVMGLAESDEGPEVAP
jgi:hypothetical protein